MSRTISVNQDVLEIAKSGKSWALTEAAEIFKKIDGKLPKKGYVLFECGYGPSGIPHLGTFVEVIRPTFVKNAFEKICDIETKLFCISDDMDGLRSIPENIPNKDMLANYLDMPLCNIPDPFGTCQSYAQNMNNRLRAFLDDFGFKYEFISSAKYYRTGKYNDTLIAAAQNYEKIINVMLPTLGQERRQTYSPFMPICPATGKVLASGVIDIDKSTNTIKFHDSNNKICETSILNGNCKLQWKPDMGMRWAALDVDFEMYGKDHLVNGKLYTEISKILSGKAPHQSFFELFLDADGRKASKSKGNAMSIEQLLKYGSKDSISLFLYQSPKKAKKLSHTIIPRSFDDYLSFLYKYNTKDADLESQIINPVYHIHNGNVPIWDSKITYSLVLNLIGACNSQDPKVIYSYLDAKDNNISKNPIVISIVSGAMNYYHDFLKSNRIKRQPSQIEKRAMLELIKSLQDLDQDASAQDIQNVVYSVGTEFEFKISTWFASLYEVLLGADNGPRFGSFVSIYGIQKTIKMIESACQNKD